jgi:hypothetical protein
VQHPVANQQVKLLVYMDDGIAELLKARSDRECDKNQEAVKMISIL